MNTPPLRILFCTNGGLHGALVLRRLLASPRVRVAGIVCSSRLLRASYGFWRGAAEYWRISGMTYSVYLWCSTSLADMLLRLSPLPPVAASARRHAIPLFTTRNINVADARAFIAGISPDLLLSAFFNQRIGRSLTALPKYGAVNIHPGLLPDFRGVDPVFFARLKRSADVGVSVHRIVDEFDAGDLLCREAMPVDSHESVFKITARLYDRGAELLLVALDRIVHGNAGTPQPAGGQYDSWPTPQQIAEFQAQGGRLISARDLVQVSRDRLLSG